MSLASILPAPTQITLEEANLERSYSQTAQVLPVRNKAPPYGQRHGWVPRSLEDFGDGGAFPEVPIPQYPLNMGKPSANKGTSSEVVPLQVDAAGKVKYDALARVGQSKDKVVHATLQDMVPKHLKADDPDLVPPDEEEIERTTEETRMALEKLVNKKISAAQPNRRAEKTGTAQYIRYTPSEQGAAYNSGAKQRVIRMVEAQRDPMEPPRFKTNKKIPRGPPSPPAPVLHSPTRKVTVKEQQDWKIPPCVSNWKNHKGYTIPLDKRLAADGRGLQDNTINDKFAKLSQALYIADREARESVRARSQVEEEIARKKKEQKEEHLRQLAQLAREERGGIKTVPATEEENDAVKERDDLRYERHKERERDRRIARAAPERRAKLERSRDRDVTEQIALGKPAGPPSHEALFDQRLFNQTRGLDAGLSMEDDVYNVYDKPWRGGGGAAQSIYRPSRNVDKEIYGDDIEKLIKTSRFQPEKGFEGADHSQPRDGPVQFQKDVEEDPFGLNKFLTEAKKGKRQAEEDNRERSKKSRH